MALGFDSKTPIYQQIAEDIRRRIVEGELRAGDQLMSTTQYATTYRINPATANKAFNQLTAEGIIFKQRGIGMFVTDDAAAILRGEGRQSYAGERLAPAIREGLALGYTPEHIRALVNDILEEK
ncbi:GntR family transcriptional regulator [Trueperella pecoris]|uniref:GntR family transcriptional regulator n=1 Tax=Trueperella pecoris TaxID=2733571 RepID=UPI001ABE04D0|nr:GntR family transcriptional regulator [Trueperella pecoris]QTG75196.1 GntR family transcriptional regulator [Trueperella pecoris]